VRWFGEGGEELVEEVAVGGVDLDEVETRGLGAFRGGCEVGDDLVHAGAIEGGGDGICLVEADGEGATGCQPPSDGGMVRFCSHGTDMLALRPAWASWVPA